jgi:hypothetical protein
MVMTDQIPWMEQIAQCSERTQQLLVAAGWRPDRQVDINQDIQELEAEGYTCFPMVQTFLRSFRGLQLQWIDMDVGSGRELQNSLWIDSAAAAGGIFPEWRSDYESFLGKPLCPIGRAENDHFTLWMDMHGRVYGTFDEMCVLYGETAVQAIDGLVMRKTSRMLRASDGTPIQEPDQGT